MCNVITGIPPIMLWQISLFAFPVPVRMLFYICKETSKATKIDRESPSRLRRRKLKTEISFWKRFTVSVHSTPPPEKFKNTTITGHFGFVVEENSGREISSLPCSRFIGECCVTSQKTAAKETRKYHDYHNVIVLKKLRLQNVLRHTYWHFSHFGWKNI